MGSPTRGPRRSADADRRGRLLPKWWTFRIEGGNRPLQVSLWGLPQGHQAAGPHAQPRAVSPRFEALGVRLRLGGQAMVRFFPYLHSVSTYTTLVVHASCGLTTSSATYVISTKSIWTRTGRPPSSIYLSVLLTYYSLLAPISLSPTVSSKSAVREKLVDQNPTPPMTPPTTSTNL